MHDLRVICARFPLNELVSAECLHLAGSLPDSEGVADNCATLEGVTQSAYLSLGVRCWAEATTLEELVGRVLALELAADRFRIELLRIALEPEISEQSAKRLLADAIEGDPDLKHPLRRFVLVVQSRRIWFGEILASCERSYRRHDSKPYHTTNSLPARLARGLVNLTQPAARSILDPFCGTGSILLEAQSLGLLAHGVDISAKLVYIARHNLAHFGYQALVRLGNAAHCRQQADAIVTDLPYGWTVVKIERDEILGILRHLVGLAPLAIYLAGEPLTDLLAQAGYSNIDVCCVRKRIGIDRYVHRAYR